MADLMVNKNDPMAVQAATQETIVCMSLDPSQASTAQPMAMAAAQRVLSGGRQETHIALLVLRDLVRRMSGMPGTRNIVLISPGFITPEEQTEKAEIMDRAVRANVVIGSLDARGLYTDVIDASRPVYDSLALRMKSQYEHDALRAQADVLAEMAAGTGGTFFENSNDLDAGFERVAAAPEFVYLLGFSPQNLKLDGSFHNLKVALKPATAMVAQARKGYYAPRHLATPEETAKEELQEAVFSREEQSELPVTLSTQFFKASDTSAKVTILMRVDARHLKFRRTEDRNCNELTIVSTLFDRNGNFVTGNQKRLEMRLKDETLAKRLENGLTVRTTFDVKPGVYMVRLVVRDAEGQLMSSVNGAVDVP